VVALVAVAATGCGDIRDLSLCTAYTEYLHAADAVQAVDPATTSAQEASVLAEDYLERVQRLRETSDDQDSIALLDLEAAARDIVLTLESVREDEDASTWQPLIEDDLEDAADAAVTVREEFENECPVAGEDS
jgi:hypothetical protein